MSFIKPWCTQFSDDNGQPVGGSTSTEAEINSYSNEKKQINDKYTSITFMSERERARYYAEHHYTMPSKGY